jgi:hypothetical protein
MSETGSFITLRFVEGFGLTSDAIEWREGTCMPLVPDHVECVDPETGLYIGAHAEGGMMARKPGYDAPFKAEFFLKLPCTPEQQKAFYDAARKAIGEPYDWEAILGFALPGHWHTKFEAICSAKMTMLLRDSANWFPSKLPLAVPFHCIDPRDLLLGLSMIVEVNH